MVMSLSPKTTSYTPSEDQTWLASAHGTQEMDSITLDGALCQARFASGVIPSGIPLAKITSTGRYAPQVDAAADGQATVVGHLFTTIDLTAGGTQPATTNSPASLFWHGEVITAKVPAYTGRIAQPNAPHIRYV